MPVKKLKSYKMRETKITDLEVVSEVIVYVTNLRCRPSVCWKYTYSHYF